MPAFTAKTQSAGAIVDAYTSEVVPAERFGYTDPTKLRVGVESENDFRTWIGFVAGTEFNVPDEAHVLSATLHTRMFVPQEFTPGDEITIRVLEAAAQHSESLITHDSLVAAETAAQNWPLREISLQTVEVEHRQSNPNYPIDAPTHFEQRLDLDITDWWNDSPAVRSRGFTIASDSDPPLYILPHETPLLASGLDKYPLISVEFGWPIDHVSVHEVTPRSAFLSWTESPGADFYLVQYATFEDQWIDVDLPATVVNEYVLTVEPSTVYAVRVAAGYRHYGRAGDYSPQQRFVTPSDESPDSQLVQPAPLVCVPNDSRQRNEITLPTTLAHPSIDRWEIARLRDVSENEDDNVIAVVSGDITRWIDRFPLPGTALYAIRGRVDALLDVWTPWSDTASCAGKSYYRSRLLAPTSTLELLTVSNGSVFDSGEAETSAEHRFPIKGGDHVHIEVQYRSKLTTGSQDTLRIGVRWYDRDGLWVGEDYEEAVLDVLNGLSRAGRLLSEAEAPNSAAEFGIIAMIAGATSTGTKCRIERVECYLHDHDNESGWDYVQIPGATGLVPDERADTADQALFTYEGVGWGKLSSPPSYAGGRAPYRETATSGDEITFLLDSMFCDVLLYGYPQESVIELLRLTDSAVRTVTDPEASLWEPIADENIGEMVFGPNLISNPDAEVNTTGWTTSSSTTPPNGLTTGATLTRLTAIPMTGAGYFSLATSAVASTGAAFTMTNISFRAGRTYMIRFNYRDAGANIQALLGSLDPIFQSTPDATYLHDIVIDELPSGAGTFTAYWVPQTDLTSAFFALRNDSGGIADTLEFDDVEVRELLGYRLPAGPDFSVQELKIPPVFSYFTNTPIRVVLKSGAMRPFGIRRDTLRPIEFAGDFDTLLRAVTSFRNLTDGEIELRADLDPPRIVHYSQRGVNHGEIEGGLDVRKAKNIVSTSQTSDPSQIANRLIVLGYGEDKTQLVYLATSVKDRQGRVPSDPYYRFDEHGLLPTDPNWDRASGGTSEEVYGKRYGVHRDPDLVTLYRAQEMAHKLVEVSAWPAETFTLELIDLEEVPTELNVGDIIPFVHQGRKLSRRLIGITTSIESPRRLILILGDSPINASAQLERVSKDLDVVLSFVNATTGAADI